MKVKIGDNVVGVSWGEKTKGILVKSDFGTTYIKHSVNGRDKLSPIDAFEKIYKQNN